MFDVTWEIERLLKCLMDASGNFSGGKYSEWQVGIIDKPENLKPEAKEIHFLDCKNPAFTVTIQERLIKKGVRKVNQIANGNFVYIFKP